MAIRRHTPAETECAMPHTAKPTARKDTLKSSPHADGIQQDDTRQSSQPEKAELLVAVSRHPFRTEHSALLAGALAAVEDHLVAESAEIKLKTTRAGTE